jgi:hypothetical protein
MAISDADDSFHTNTRQTVDLVLFPQIPRDHVITLECMLTCTLHLFALSMMNLEIWIGDWHKNMDGQNGSCCIVY